MGRWSRPVARQFLQWLAIPPRRKWLDVGCGTGALSELIAAAGASAVVGIDASPEFAAHARGRRHDPRTTYLVGDAQALPLPTGWFDVAVSGLALNFVPSADRAVSDMARVVRPGGTVAVYVWDYAEGMQFLRVFWDTAAAIDPRAAELDEGRRFPLCRPDALMDLFRTVGLEDAEVIPLDVATSFSDFDDLWQPFLGGQGPAPSYIRGLGDDARERLRERFRLAVTGDAELRIELHARAWGVRASRPEGYGLKGAPVPAPATGC